jgi:predicted CXXCH cytochrome family protein
VAFLVGFVLLAPSAQVSAGSVSPQEVTPTPTTEALSTPSAQRAATSTCEGCHPEEVKEWYASAHSLARTDHVLEQASNCSACHPPIVDGQMAPPGAPATPQSGDPGGGRNCVVCHTTGYDPNTNKSKSYGVTCEACHSPVPLDHPNKKMPIDVETDLCARCHSDSRFNWSEWKKSKHYQQYMGCVECHSPHSTSLRYVSTEGNKSTLCLSCHETTSEMSPYSIHGRAGVTCEDCHLGAKQGPDMFHVVPNHSFEVQIETCKKCHADAIHRAEKPGEAVPAAVNINPSSTPYVSPTMEATKEDKSSGSSTSLILVAALMILIGLMIGVIFSSRLKNLLR